MDPFLQAAIDEAKLGLSEGGIPIGSVLVIDGKIVARGHNRRVQRGSAVLHAEMDCLENAGRLTAADYARSTLYSTLSPCDMCSGAVLLYKIPTVIVGENKTFQGPEELLSTAHSRMPVWGELDGRGTGGVRGQRRVRTDALAVDEELEKYQVTEKTREHWTKWHRRFQEVAETKEEERLDTVGAICMDPMGNVAAALSSGGVAYKVPGRLGLAGCPRMGCDASNAVRGTRNSRKRKRGEQSKVKNAFAVACTGRGEHFIRSNLVGTLARRLTKSADLERGLRKTFTEASEGNGGVGIEGGVLALVSAPPSEEDASKGNERRVQLGAAFSTPCMGVGFLHCRADVRPEVQVQLLRQPASRHSVSDRVRLVEITNDIILAKFDEYERHLNRSLTSARKLTSNVGRSSPSRSELTMSYLKRKSSRPNTKLP
ncbi:Nucleophile aminohydrolase [Phytophthora cactorum]|nr:Nucleophile aminohydrolase [Phytophthora cactorum]